MERLIKRKSDQSILRRIDLENKHLKEVKREKKVFKKIFYQREQEVEQEEVQ